MDLEQHALKKFLAVVEELNFNRAAQRLHVSQPALSQAIRRLETALGKNLFRRNSYGVTLTDFDEIFRDIAPTFGSRGDPGSRFSPNRVRLHRRIPFGL